MIIPRQLAPDIPVARREVEAHTRAELPGAFAMDLLPGCLILGHFRLPGGATFFPFRLGNEGVAAAGIEIDDDAVAGFEQGEPASDG